MILFFSIVIITCRKPRESQYPFLISSYNLQEQFDEGKFLIYCWHLLEENSILSDSITTSNLEIEFDTLIVDSSSYVMTFVWDGKVKNYPEEGVLHKLFYKEDKIEYLELLGYQYHFSERSIFDKDLTKELIKILKNNRGNLNPWLEMEAQKKGFYN